MKLQCFVCRVNMHRVYKILNQFGVWVDNPELLFKCPKCGDKIILELEV